MWRRWRGWRGRVEGGEWRVEGRVWRGRGWRDRRWRGRSRGRRWRGRRWRGGWVAFYVPSPTLFSSHPLSLILSPLPLLPCTPTSGGGSVGECPEKGRWERWRECGEEREEKGGAEPPLHPLPSTLHPLPLYPPPSLHSLPSTLHPPSQLQSLHHTSNHTPTPNHPQPHLPQPNPLLCWHM